MPPASPTLTLAFMLGMVLTIMPVSVDTTIPAMTLMAEAFDTDGGTIQLTLSVLLVGVALGQLVHGPLSDRVGRKPVILGAIAVSGLAALGTALTNSFEALLAWRFLSGFAICAGMIVTRAVARDLYERMNAAQLLSAAAMFLGLSPIITPIIGGYLAARYGWAAPFWLIVGYSGILLVAASIFLKESLPPSRRRSSGVVSTVRDFSLIIRQREFRAYLYCSAPAYAGLFAFISASSVVMISQMDVRPEIFGYYFSMVMMGHAGAAGLGARLVRSRGTEWLLKVGSRTLVTGALSMAVLAFAGINHPFAIAVPMFAYMFGFSFIYPVAMSGSMSAFPHMAGTASSLFGFLQQLGSFAVVTALGVIGGTWPHAMTTTIGLCGIAVFLAARHAKFFERPNPADAKATGQ